MLLFLSPGTAEAYDRAGQKAGIVICAIYVLATCTCTTPQSIAMAVFTAVMQIFQEIHDDGCFTPERAASTE